MNDAEASKARTRTGESSGQLRPFLRRTQLLPGESLPSFLIRLMSLNGYQPGVLAELVGARTTDGGRRSAAGRLSDDMERPQRAITYFRLSELTKLAPVRLYQASVHAFAPTLVPQAREPGVSAYLTPQVARVKENLFLSLSSRGGFSVSTYVAMRRLSSARLACVRMRAPITD